MSNPTSKSQRIDLWRQEVALASSATTETTTAPGQRRRSSRTSFLARLLKSKKNGLDGREGAFESTVMYRMTLGSDAPGARATRGKGAGRDQERGRECEGESMAIADVSASSSLEDGLVAKQERLKRAARLLGKDGGREGKD